MMRSRHRLRAAGIPEGGDGGVMTDGVARQKQPMTQLPRPGFHYLPSVTVVAETPVADEYITTYFVDGVVADIASSLARMPQLAVIDAGMSASVTGRRHATMDAAAALGAAYLVAIAVARDDQHLAFTIKLQDVRRRELIWTEEISANIDDLFEIQHHIVARATMALVPRIQDVEIERALARPPRSLTAYDWTLRALPAVRGLVGPAFERSDEMLSTAISLDPRYAMPHAWKARIGSLRIGQGWARDRDAESREAMRHARAAIEIDETNALALATAGHLHAFLFADCDTALTLFDKALQACPNDALSWMLSSATLAYVGRFAEARASAEHAVVLSPFDHCPHHQYTFAGIACYGAGDYPAAIAWCRKALAENSRYTSTHKVLAAALVGDGRIAEAREVARELRRLDPVFGVDGRISTPIKDEAFRRRFTTQLRTAGAIAPVGTD